MEQWNVRDDRPYMRPEPRSYTWLIVTLAFALIAGLAGAFYWYASSHVSGLSLPELEPAPVAPPRLAAPAEAPPPALAAAPEASAPPEIRHPLPVPEPKAAKRLPSLEMSDTMMRRSLAELMGREAFASLVIPKELVRRIVATIDNLPREIAAQRMVPLNPVKGRFAVAGRGEKLTLDAANFARYAPYVKAFESVSSRMLVKAYIAAYPLFQKAYEELGYPGQHFNDRLLEAIDDMLAAPEVEAPIALMQPKVLYEFADPDLQTRSAGQKILIRMGPENAGRVKAKLHEIRRELIAAAERRS